MIKMTLVVATTLLSCVVATAQENTVAAPVADVANYDPTLSAKEAVLANWELAAAGIRAGRIVSANIVEMAETDAPYGVLVRQAQFAQKTMVQRYNSALWIQSATDRGEQFEIDANALTDAVAAVNAPCDLTDCSAQRAKLVAAFERATTKLETAAQAARAELDLRVDKIDAILLSEQLSIMSDYLASTDWGRDFHLTEFGRDGEELAARIVGAVALWRNIEPYVGLANKEVDAAINDASRHLLRTMRHKTRGATVLDSNGPEIAEIKAAADVLAIEFKRAAALFAS
ncbi:MAG: hypothetical protein AAFY99_05630 [Pseudomonadota bacterium]